MADAFMPNEIDDPVIAIGILAERAGLSAAAVRKYESEGLIISHRTASGRRLFSREDISRVRNIQHMIRQQGLNIEGIRRMQALLPCWHLHACTVEARGNCPAHTDGTRPCWMIKGVHCGCRPKDCRECVVYRFGSLCTEHIKRLLYGEDDPQSAGAAVRDLMRRKIRWKEQEKS